MRVYTQAEFDALPVEHGIRQCPSGDYTQVKMFGEECSFSEECSFGEGCSFGGGCRFGEGCNLEGVELLGPSVLSAGGLGRENRTTYGIPHAGGVRVRCGCWAGELDEFRARVSEVHGDSPIGKEYQLMADLFELRGQRARMQSKESESDGP